MRLCGILQIQLIDPTNKNVKKIATELQNLKLVTRPNSVKYLHPELHFRVETALIYDAVKLFADALQRLKVSKNIDSKKLYCNQSNSWEHGLSVINYMKTSVSK